MIYKLFGYWIRREACRLAARVVQGQWAEGKEPLPNLWSMTVFFESYLLSGASGTRESFGPSEPVDIRIVKDNFDGVAH